MIYKLEITTLYDLYKYEIEPVFGLELVERYKVDNNIIKVTFEVRPNGSYVIGVKKKDIKGKYYQAYSIDIFSGDIICSRVENGIPTKKEIDFINNILEIGNWDYIKNYLFDKGIDIRSMDKPNIRYRGNNSIFNSIRRPPALSGLEVITLQDIFYSEYDGDSIILCNKTCEDYTLHISLNNHPNGAYILMFFRDYKDLDKNSYVLYDIFGRKVRSLYYKGYDITRGEKQFFMESMDDYCNNNTSWDNYMNYADEEWGTHFNGIVKIPKIKEVR